MASFAGYKDFADCERQNQDKGNVDDVDTYCSKKRTEGHMAGKQLSKADAVTAQQIIKELGNVKSSIEKCRGKKEPDTQNLSRIKRKI